MQKYFEYRSISDMNNIILRNLHIFPHDIDLVVGIPRSGMMPANLIALYLNKPYTDIDSFISGRILGAGRRGSFIEKDKTNRVLVVDDSISTGESMKEAKQKCAHVSKDYKIYWAAIFATSESKKQVDFYCEIIDYPRIFQWNFFHSYHITKSCFDIDGVLCVDPVTDDDGPVYTEYISHATPLYQPTVCIDTIVSCRLEKYRSITEKWLQDNHIQYKHLVMLDFPNKAERVKWGRHGEYKAGVYKKSSASLFVESSLAQARTIAAVSGKPVFCTETFDLVYGGGILQAKLTTRLKRKIKKFLRKFSKQ